MLGLEELASSSVFPPIWISPSLSTSSFVSDDSISEVGWAFASVTICPSACWSALAGELCLACCCCCACCTFSFVSASISVVELILISSGPEVILTFVSRSTPSANPSTGELCLACCCCCCCCFSCCCCCFSCCCSCSSCSCNCCCLTCC